MRGRGAQLPQQTKEGGLAGVPGRQRQRKFPALYNSFDRFSLVPLQNYSGETIRQILDHSRAICGLH